MPIRSIPKRPRPRVSLKRANFLISSLVNFFSIVPFMAHYLDSCQPHAPVLVAAYQQCTAPTAGHVCGSRCVCADPVRNESEVTQLYLIMPEYIEIMLL